jgi:antitoxin component of RelBE/YafQ-DinJ toxin-antitoxin module
MSKKTEIAKIRADIRQAMQIADEMREHNRAYRQTLQTIFNDEAIPLEVRQQYERLLVKQLTQGGVF